MQEALFIRMVACLVEVVHVELADERRKVVMFEVTGQNTLCELVGLFYHKAVTLVTPTDNVV